MDNIRMLEFLGRTLSVELIILFQSLGSAIFATMNLFRNVKDFSWDFIHFQNMAFVEVILLSVFHIKYL